MHLLILEDNTRLAELIAEALGNVGWTVDLASTLREAEEITKVRRHDVMVFDLGLPDGDGRSLVKTMREQEDNVPILILSAKTMVEDRIDALDCGADDYLTKPFQNEELIARCRSLVRRKQVTTNIFLSIGNLKFDPAAQRFAINSQPFELGVHSHLILSVLLDDAGRVVPRERLLNTLSSYGREPRVAALDKEVSRLRTRLLALGATCSIEAIRGIGFMIRAKQS